MDPAPIGVLGAAGALTGAVLAWLVARRQTSGRVDTSQAETLWDEARAIRLELRAEVAALRAEIMALRVEATALRADAVTCAADLAAIRAELAGSKPARKATRRAAT